MQIHDTIVAVATPPGRGGLGIVRISGSAARAVAEQVVRFPHADQWQGWRARIAEMVDSDGHAVDRVVVTFYERPRSYTAEDVVEVSCHGSPALLRHCVEQALRAGARLAEPGEFTLRAYLNGRIDLPQAEAVRDLIDATTLYQARVAARQAEGSVSRRIAPLKEQLLELIALLEAGIDFAEDDVSVAPAEQVLRRLDPVLAGVRQLAASYQYGAMVREGMALAIVGRPNVGKSSLFNRLLEQDRAIVTDTPGATRDLISETAAIGGIPVKLYDTAGIRQGAEKVESLGIERSFQAMADADLVLVVADLSQPVAAQDLELIARAEGQGRWLLVGNKCDLPRVAELARSPIPVSALTGEGVAELRAAIREAVAPKGVLEQETGFITSLRQERLLSECAECLAKARGAVETAVPHEMLLLDLYAALQAVDGVTGATTADDILNRIFSTFCIGK